MGQRLVISGAHGELGRAVVQALSGRGHQVVLLTPDPSAAEEQLPGAARYVLWNGMTVGPWVETLEGADTVLNLADAPLWGPGAPRRHAFEAAARTRLMGARVMAQGIEAVLRKPRRFVSLSSVEYYGAGAKAPPADETTPPGRDELARRARAWEAAADEVRTFGVPVVLVRLGLVLGRNEGVLPMLARLFERHLGGPLLPGGAWWPWIHQADAVGIVQLVVDSPQLTGPLNATAPAPRTSAEVSRAVGHNLGRASWLPHPGLWWRSMRRDVAALPLTQGRKVLPVRAEQLGYTFRYPRLEDALADLLKGRREALLPAGAVPAGEASRAKT
jgi:uncharacterized protein (TIGR01777 family)